MHDEQLCITDVLSSRHIHFCMATEAFSWLVHLSDIFPRNIRTTLWSAFMSELFFNYIIPYEGVDG